VAKVRFFYRRALKRANLPIPVIEKIERPVVKLPEIAKKPVEPSRADGDRLATFTARVIRKKISKPAVEGRSFI
jgi:hypothetical protein